MIKHLQSRLLVCSSAMLACLLLAATSSHADKLPPSVQTAADASGFKGQIDTFINKQLEILKAGGDGVKDARESLALAATTTGASPSFLQIYSSALAANMAAQGIAAAPDVRVRLNAAIVVDRVAVASGNAALAELATTFAQDKSEAVALWGVKAAQPLLPAILISAGNPKNLATAVISAVKTQSDSESIPEDAYNALTLFTMSEAAKGKVPPAAFKDFVQYPLDLLAFRVSLYQNAIPKNPRYDGMGTGYLAGNYGWRFMSAQQQTQTASLILTIANAAANQLDVYPTRPDLIALVKAAANAFEAIGRTMGDTTIEKAANALRTSIGDNSSKDDVLAKIKPMEDAVKARFSANAIAGH